MPYKVHVFLSDITPSSIPTDWSDHFTFDSKALTVEELQAALRGRLEYTLLLQQKQLVHECVAWPVEGSGWIAIQPGCESVQRGGVFQWATIEVCEAWGPLPTTPCSLYILLLARWPAGGLVGVLLGPGLTKCWAFSNVLLTAASLPCDHHHRACSDKCPVYGQKTRAFNLLLCAPKHSGHQKSPV